MFHFIEFQCDDFPTPITTSHIKSRKTKMDVAKSTLEFQAQVMECSSICEPSNLSNVEEPVDQ